MLSYGWAITRNVGVGALIAGYLWSRHVGGKVNRYHSEKNKTEENKWRLYQLLTLSILGVLLALIIIGSVNDVSSDLTQGQRYARYWFIGLIATYVVVSLIYPIFMGIGFKVYREEAEELKRRTIGVF